MPRGKIRQLAGKAHVQYAVAFLAQGEAYGVSVAIRGQAAAVLCITDIAGRLQLDITGTRASLPRSCTHARPTCPQWETLRKGPVGFESLFGHEERTSHSILAV